MEKEESKDEKNHDPFFFLGVGKTIIIKHPTIIRGNCRWACSSSLNLLHFMPPIPYPGFSVLWILLKLPRNLNWFWFIDSWLSHWSFLYRFTLLLSKKPRKNICFPPFPFRILQNPSFFSTGSCFVLLFLRSCSLVLRILLSFHDFLELRSSFKIFTFELHFFQSFRLLCLKK